MIKILRLYIHHPTMVDENATPQSKGLNLSGAPPDKIGLQFDGNTYSVQGLYGLKSDTANLNMKTDGFSTKAVYGLKNNTAQLEVNDGDLHAKALYGFEDKLVGFGGGDDKVNAFVTRDPFHDITKVDLNFRDLSTSTSHHTPSGSFNFTGSYNIGQNNLQGSIFKTPKNTGGSIGFTAPFPF